MVPRVTAVLIAAIACGLPLVVPVPAAADSFFFGYSAGHHHHHHRHRHWQHHYRRHHHWRPHYYSGFAYVPPPRVIYTPPPVVYVPPPLAALPTSPIYQRDGWYCREYQTTVTVNGVPQPSYGTACLQPDGAWRVVN